MEEIQNTESTSPDSSIGCINCSNPVVVKGFPNALCETCRDNYIKFPIPLWVKAFTIGIGIIFLFSLYKLPPNIASGVHLEKGKIAMEQKKYLTAQKELQKVADILPNNLEAQGTLLIAAFNNQDWVTLNKAYTVLLNKKFDDEDLYDKVNRTVQDANAYYPKDSFTSIMQHYGNDINKVPINILKNYVDSNKDDLSATTSYAGLLLNTGSNYAVADSVLTNILATNPEYIPALSAISSLKRQENKLDESIEYCNKILFYNSESVYGLASKARTYLKQKRNDEAYKLAMQSYQLNNKDMYAIATVILAANFSNKIKERDDMLQKALTLKDSADADVLQYAQDVIKGKEKF